MSKPLKETMTTRKRKAAGEADSPKRRLSLSSEAVSDRPVEPTQPCLDTMSTFSKTEILDFQRSGEPTQPCLDTMSTSSKTEILDFQRSGEPTQPCLDTMSTFSKTEILDFQRSGEPTQPCLDTMSTSSKTEIIDFQSIYTRCGSGEPTQPCLDTMSKSSKIEMINLQSVQERKASCSPAGLSLASNYSMFTPMNFRSEPKGPQGLPCCVCERTFDDNPVCFACGHVACTSCVITAKDDLEVVQFHCTVCGTYQRLAPNQALKLPTRDRKIFEIIRGHKKEMHDKFSMMSEGNGDERIPLKHIYTPLSINFGNSVIQEEYNLRLMIRRTNSKEEVVDLSSLFQNVSIKSPRTVLTNGVAGIGKTFSVQKLIVDWAEGTSNKDVHFVFSLCFRELNLIKEDMSLLQLLKGFHPAVSELNPQDLDITKVIVILDGFDESRFHLDFSDSQKLSSVQEAASVSKLMMNLIKGNLLPNAQLWITSRPAASYLIPGEYIHKVSEIQGFKDQQKEEYFQKRFRNKPDVAKMVISYIQSSQTLNLLCQIPIFCWMCSVLLEEVFGREEQTEAPQTLTEIMGAFLSVQTKRSSRKYDKNPERERTRLLKAKRGFLLKLGKLAFIHLLDNSLIFYIEDLQACGLDPEEATVNSGFFNSVFRQDQLFSQQKVFYFVHLTIQEFFAAVYVYDCFTNNKDWAPELSRFLDLDPSESSRPPVFDLLKTTVDKILKKSSCELYFFQRFLLGLMVESNQKVVHGLLNPQKSDQDTVRNMLGHLKAIRRRTVSPDACINLFQTMVEMGDSKIIAEIQEYLKNTERAPITLTPLHCSALAFTIQSSKSVLEELELKSYNTSEEGRRRLIPAVRSCKKANLSECKASEALLKPLSLALSFPHSSLRDLDLTNSDLGDSGVKLLSEGLKSPVCKLKILRLSGCLVTEVGCDFLVSALKLNPTHLKELDMSYNHLKTSGETALKDLMRDPQYNLSHLQLNFSHGGSNRMIPGLKKYWLDLSWDAKQASAGLQFSDDHREVSRSDETPDHVLVWGAQKVSERCYWEIDASEPFNTGVAHQSEEQERTELRLGQSETSWSFVCSPEGCYAFHNNQRFIVSSAHCSRSSRLAVYLDRPAGVLSLFRVSTDSRTCLHTFREKFNKDLFPTVELKPKSSAKFYREATRPEEHKI